MKRLLLPAAVALIAVGAVYWFAFRGEEPRDELVISGNIEVTEVDIAFPMPGKLAELLVEEGDSVEQGQILARLDREELEERRERARAAIEAARARLSQTRAAIRYQTENLAGAVAQRRADLRSVQANLAELESGSRRQEIAQAAAAVEQARTAAEKAARDLERGERLIAREDISRQHFDQLKTQAEAATAALEQSRERYELVREGPRKETIEAGEARVEQAAAALRTAEAGGLELERLRAELPARRADIAAAEAELAIAETQLEDAVATSPVDGIVLTKAAERGETVGAGAVVLTVGDLERPWLRGYINQVYQGRVKVGSAVEVTTDSYPDKTYQGRLTFLASEAEFTPKQIQTQEERVKLVYRVKIQIPNPNQELKRNMPADAVIPLEPAAGRRAARTP